jgi:hypothetical protein
MDASKIAPNMATSVPVIVLSTSIEEEVCDWMTIFDDANCAADGSVAPEHANDIVPADAPLESVKVKILLELLNEAVLVRPEGTLKVHDGFDGHEKLVTVAKSLPA